MDPKKQIYWEQDGYFVFVLNDTIDASQWQGESWTWEPGLRLEGYGIAQSDETGAFIRGRLSPTPGHILRVELYLTALKPMDINYSVSVRTVTPDGNVVAQDDSWPAGGLWPTILWPTGQTIRDTHYLALPAEDLPGPLVLKVVVYESATMKIVGPAFGYTLTTLGEE
jgi:hypothetical protein